MENPKTKQKGTFEGVTFYHWLVVIIASCGWLFDCMDQRIFVLARESALNSLLGADEQSALETFIGIATGSMIFGWATGGIIFGMMSDKVGRVKTMVTTLLVYSLFTGVSGLAQSWIDFTIYRFLVGLGVGGMFGAATTLVAESVPGNFRSMALGSLQALSATGNLIGSMAALWVNPGQENFLGDFSGWRVLFFVGIVPAILVIPIVFGLREPEAWKEAKRKSKDAKVKKAIGSPIELFRDRRWRHHTIVGLCLGVSGMVGLWGIGFFSPELVTHALSDTPIQPTEIKEPQKLLTTIKEAESPAVVHIKGQLAPETIQQLDAASQDSLTNTALIEAVVADLNTAILGGCIYEEGAFDIENMSKRTRKSVDQYLEEPEEANISRLNRELIEFTLPSIPQLQSFIDGVRAKAMALQDVGAFLGMLAFTLVASYLNRRKAFFFAFVLCLISTIFVFYSLETETDAYWMLPLMGFAQLAVFAGYSIYFPELYPTRLRGTGVGFCYNTVRYLAAPTPILMGYLSTIITFRTAAIIMSSIYLLGLIALVWAPETKGQPLPED
ncbi:MAG: MFS transporter [Verrucomicrobia bacterium]|nr:MFS transporter [Verrucomicrobiota bacterium]